jgi:hypothetical protein
MKGLLIVLIALVSLNTFSAEQCSPEAQEEIDSLLSQISSTDDEIKKVDLEFEVRQISHSYVNCRKSIDSGRNIASVETQELPVMENETAVDESQLMEQAKANLEIEEVLKLK